MEFIWIQWHIRFKLLKKLSKEENTIFLMGGFNIDLVPNDKNSDSVAPVNSMHVTAWKVSVFGIFLVHIFPHLDWIRRDTQNAVKTGQKNSEYGYFFTQCAAFPFIYLCQIWYYYSYHPYKYHQYHQDFKRVTKL